MKTKYTLSVFFSFVNLVIIIGCTLFVSYSVFQRQASAFEIFIAFFLIAAIFRELTTIRLVEFRSDNSIYLRSRINSWTIDQSSIESATWKGPWGGRGEPRIELKTGTLTLRIPGVINSASEILSRLQRR